MSLLSQDFMADKRLRRWIEEMKRDLIAGSMCIAITSLSCKNPKCSLLSICWNIVCYSVAANAWLSHLITSMKNTWTPTIGAIGAHDEGVILAISLPCGSLFVGTTPSYHHPCRSDDNDSAPTTLSQV